MLLVADSGSTKADWKITKNGSIVESTSTMGFNPFFHNAETIINALSENQSLLEAAANVKRVYFYGAGCSSDDRNEIIATPLRHFFKNAEVVVDHDIKASVLATCGDEPGIAAILGTGSNSCFFDGTTIHHNNYGLGYILGDEGSGSYFGKKLLTYYLYDRLPQDVKADFEAHHQMNKEILIEHVYHKPNANVWLASWCKFLSNHKANPFIYKLVADGLAEFYDLYVEHLPNYKNLKVHFVGSIAHYFSDILREVGAKRGILVGKVIKQPIHDLTEYFLSKEKSKA